jgi:cytochrome c oxidase subunit 2
MKRSAFLSTSIAGTLVLSACSGASLTGNVTGMDSSSQTMETSSAVMMENSSAMMQESSAAAMMQESSAAAMMNKSSAATDGAMESGDAMSAEDSAKARVIEVGVTNWEFSPKTITIKKGEKVILRLSDVDGIHSFLAADLGLNVRINPGETKDVEIPTDKAGTFSFRCGVPCGPGHNEMMGTIVVAE